MCVDRSSGPGWTDVKDYLMALDRLHGCSTTVVLRPDGSVASLVWLVCLHSAWPDLESGSVFAELSSCVEWPNKASKTLEAATYNLCYQHDHAIGQRMYQQQELPQDA